jgi:SARP family transcriptional regulator, regulator of embCAB operon
MEIRVLGPIELAVTPDQRPAALKQRAVLGALAVNCDRVVSTEQLIKYLWPLEMRPSTARTALQVHISGLRKHFREMDYDPELVETRPPGYLLRLKSGVSLDLRNFEAEVERARMAELGNRIAEAARTLSRALTMWRGPALADLRGFPALDLVGRRLDEQRMTAYERLVELELRLGWHASVVCGLLGAVAEFPLRETLHAHLMLALYRSGRTAEALAAYEAARKLSVEQLGLEPGPALSRLHYAILTRDAAIAAPV